MEPKQITRCFVAHEKWDRVYQQLKASDGRWIRFGDQLAVFSSGDPQRISSELVVDTSARFQSVAESELYVVSQKGRLFQMDYPDIPVIIDKGRFLLVRATEAQLAAITVDDAPCYSIRQFQHGETVFQSPSLPPEARVASAGWINDLAAAVDEQTYRAAVGKLVSFRTRHSISTEFRDAVTWCQAELDAMGYETRVDPISVGGAVSQNLIAQRDGSAVDRHVILVTAHLDSVNAPSGVNAEAPGADDNASGSAGVLEVARALKDHTVAHDLRLILFGGEEQGLFGSRQYVASLSDAERERIKAVVNMDMIGNQNNDRPTVLLEGGEISRDVIQRLTNAAANQTSLLVQTSFNPHNSDHESFIDIGVPAVLTIEGVDGANTDVHTASDTFEKIDFPLALEILRMNVAFVAQQLERVDG